MSNVTNEIVTIGECLFFVHVIGTFWGLEWKCALNFCGLKSVFESFYFLVQASYSNSTNLWSQKFIEAFDFEKIS